MGGGHLATTCRPSTETGTLHVKHRGGLLEGQCTERTSHGYIEEPSFGILVI